MAEVLLRRAVASDSSTIGRLLDRFNREYDDPTPGPAALAARLASLMAGGDTIVLLAGEAPSCDQAVAVLRLRPAIWSEDLECYLAELYVEPERRGRGIGRALLTAAIEHARQAGAGYMDLGTSEDDRAARALYESFGFSNREGRPDGPINYYYELEL